MHDSVTVLLPRIFVLSTAPFVPFYSRGSNPRAQRKSSKKGEIDRERKAKDQLGKIKGTMILQSPCSNTSRTRDGGGCCLLLHHTNLGRAG
jgi:hypothetical protein